MYSCRGRPGTCTHTNRPNLESRFQPFGLGPTGVAATLLSPWSAASVVQVSPQVSEGHLELQLLLGQRLHLLDEVLEGRLELVPHFPLHLLCVEVVPVVHVLVLAQVRGDLAHLRVELDVRVAPLAEHDGVLERRGGEEEVKYS